MGHRAAECHYQHLYRGVQRQERRRRGQQPDAGLAQIAREEGQRRALTGWVGLPAAWALVMVDSCLHRLL
jgi:hypothetical protein